MEPWFTATDPVKAPLTLTDLMLLKNILEYMPVSPLTAECALKAFREHLWYLSEECNIGRDKKGHGSKTYTVAKKQTAKSRLRYLHPAKADIFDLSEKDLDHFVTRNTLNFFAYLGLDTDFLENDPATWHSEKSYLEGLETVKALQVVNDVGERGVAHVKSYTASGTVTTKESEFQRLLVVTRKLMMEESLRDMTVKGFIEKINAKIDQ
ncbi:hypothetical protein FOCC_FOCC016079 [Frankliniella occidentalis]|nr:hypothetical protein FOCC_FOCC016079 [Frankliniella occidentalis]